MILNASLSTDTQLGGLYNNRANNVVEIRKSVFRMDVVDVEVQYIEVLLVKKISSRIHLGVALARRKNSARKLMVVAN